MGEHDVREAIAAELGEMLNLPRAAIRDDSDLIDELGVDSLTLTHLMLGVEQRLGVRIPNGGERHLAGVRTVGECVLRFLLALG